ncbi:MAG: PDZ domain-containing protein, partial [Kofleriaceae bacterium]
AQRTMGGLALGDIIKKVGTTEIHRASDLYKALDAHNVGDTIEITLENRGASRTVKLTLQAAP